MSSFPYLNLNLGQPGKINNITLTNAIYKHIEGEVRKMPYIPSALSNGVNTPGLVEGTGSLVQQLLPECIQVVMTTLERTMLQKHGCTPVFTLKCQGSSCDSQSTRGSSILWLSKEPGDPLILWLSTVAGDHIYLIVWYSRDLSPLMTLIITRGQSLDTVKSTVLTYL